MATISTEEGPHPMICIFCYGDCEESGPAEDEYIVEKFLTVLRRYLDEDANITWNFDDLEAPVMKKPCLSCSNILKCVCELHYQMKSIQLKMEWKLETLISKMEVANRTPSKIRRLKRRAENDFGSSLEEDNDGRMEKVQKVVNFRQSLVSRCNVKLSESRPKVILQKQNVVEASYQENTRVTDADGILFCLKSSNLEKEKLLPGELEPNAVELDDNNSYCDVGDMNNPSDDDNDAEEKYCPMEDSCLVNDSNPQRIKDSERNNKVDEHVVETASNSQYSSTSKREKRKNTCKKKLSKVQRKSKSQSKVVYCAVPGCSEKFDTEQDLENHMELHGPFKCQFCDVVKDYAPDLSIHEAEEHAINHSVVNHPSTSSLSTVRTEKSTQIKNYKCPRCTYSCMKKISYVKHHLEAHLNLSLMNASCEICMTRLKLEGKRIHFQSHHRISGMDPSDVKRCNLCLAYFRRADQLLLHIHKMHGINTRCTCPQCGKVFTLAVNLKYHMNKFHKDENLDLPLACDVPNCKKRFPNQAVFDWHKLHFVHSKNIKMVKVVKCLECNKKCQGENALRTHMKSHKRSEHVCEQCGASFKRRYTLKLHYDFHKGPDNWEFQCQECGKKCATRHRLEEHMYVHSDEKRHECQACRRKFRNRQNLRIHVNTHHAHEGFQDIPRAKVKPKFISKRERDK